MKINYTKSIVRHLKQYKKIQSFRTLDNLKFIEYPKLGFKELDKIVKKVNQHDGGILLIDYGHLNVIKESTLQAVMKNKN